MPLRHTALNFEKKVNRFEPKIKTNKIKILCLTDYRIFPICIDEQNIKHLGNVVSADDGTEIGVTQPINNARSAFTVLSKI